MPKDIAVFGVEKGETRLIVAAQNPTKAAKLFTISKYLLDQHGFKPSEREEEIARKDPGAVMAQHPDASEWTVLVSARKALALKPHGGYREPAGRKPLGNGLSKPRGVSMDDELWATFLSLGGSKFLRQVLTSGIDFNQAEWDELSRVGGADWIREQLQRSSKPDRSRRGS